MKKSFSFVLAALAVFFLVFTGCKIESSPSSKSVKKYNGTIYGKALYSNTEDNSSIQITLDKTDGLRSAAVLESCGINDRSCYSIDGSSSDSRTVVSYTACDENGSYSFSNLEPGVYTVYALAKDSSERAVSRNISVVEDGKVLVPDLQLTATGSLSGKITVEGNESNNAGFVVFIAGTSYMAITGSNGSFTISDIPAGPGYEIVIMYGTYTYYWKNNVEVKPFVTTPVAEKVFTQDEYQTITNKQKGEDGKDGENGKDGEAGKDGTSIVWKGSFDSEDKLKNPQYLWAYFNTKDGCSYIYDGKEWTLLSYKGADGKDAAQYEIRTTDIPSGDPEYPAGAMKIEILKDGVVVETEYIEKTGQTFINYELNGGLFHKSPIISRVYGNTIDLETPDKANYIFSGWYLDSNFSGEKISKIECNETNSKVTVYAKWIVGKQVYTIDELSVYLSSLSASNDPYNVLLNSETVDFEKLNTCLKNIKNGVKISFILPNGITTIPNGAFTNCIGLNSVTIPESVTFIGDSVFSGCRSLTSVNIPSGVKSIGDSVFENCSSLKTIDIPSSITSIGENAFNGCSSLTSIIIPSGVKSIDVSVFENCSSLTTIDIPSSITSIGKNAFKGCSRLTTIDIPTSISSIGENAFKGCSSLTSVTIPSSVKSIDVSVFENCSSLATIDIPSSITSIGKNAFKGCSSLTSVTIPSSVKAIDVSVFENCSSLSTIDIPTSITSIGENAFKGCSSLTSVNIPSGVTSIGVSVFENCSSLASIDIPTSITSIGENAFNGCSSLTSVNIPSSVTSIGYGAFAGCSGLTSVTIPSSVTSIGQFAFAGCSGLTSVTIPSSVTSIGAFAFRGCKGLTSITIPSSVNAIYSGAFAECDGLTQITVDTGNPNYDSRDNCNAIIATANNTLVTGCKNTVIPSIVTSIWEYAFAGCRGLTSVTIPSSVTSIGYGAFNGCEGLSYINIPSNVIAIGDFAFSWCSELTSVVIEYGVTSIGANAFFYCSNLVTITIPSSVSYIGKEAFLDCENLKQINYIGTKEQWNCIVSDFNYYFKDYINIGLNDSTTINYFLDNTYLDALLSAGDGYVNVYVDELSLPSFVKALRELNIPRSIDLRGSNLETIPAKAFLDCTSLRSVILPSSVTSIEARAFEGCRSLTSVTIPSSVKSIGDSAFEYCNCLTSITIPSSVTSIGYDAFNCCNGCSQISVDTDNPKYDSRNNCNAIIETATNTLVTGCKNTVIPSSVTSISDYAFYYCRSLSSIVIPSSVTEIGECAFSGCSGLTSVTIPSISICNDIFGFCENLTKVTITHAVDGRIGNMGFDIENLSDVIIADGVTSIGDYAFYGCSGLTTVTIPSSVTTIGTYAFEGCSGLTSITIPSSVTSIGSDAFRGCSGLTSVTIPSSVTTIASSAFSYCDNLTQITVDTNNPKYDSRNNCNAIIDTATNTLVIGCKDTIIPSSVTEIGDFAFEGCSGLESITIPSSLTTIGVGAFYDCIGLTSITIPDSVINIGDSAFYGCTNLEGLPFEDSETFYRLFYFDVIRRKD